MKKFIATLVLSIATMVGVPLMASAATTPGVTDVSGTVTANGHPLSGATVTVTCNSSSLTDDTDSSGAYLVQFPLADCPSGATATASATKGSTAGSNSGKVNGVVPTRLNVAVVDVNISLPEMGALTGGVAIVAAGGTFLLIRRRQTGDQK